LRSIRELVPDNIPEGDMLTSLLKWFKNYMQWTPKQIICNRCIDAKSDVTRFMETRIQAGDSPDVRKVEIHTCSSCGAEHVFPRYNDVLKIAEIRTGRCSEWSILFGAILNSLSLQTRIVHDYLDHCWNEVLLDGRWTHVDSTLEYPTSLDHPHFYEKNWKKNYQYVLAFTADKIDDVTERYTEQWESIIARRQNLQMVDFNQNTMTELQNFYSGM
jgi:peptide-N4-(N-acetyl-beta-glucosaminyl)asparagine amidase